MVLLSQSSVCFPKHYSVSCEPIVTTQPRGCLVCQHVPCQHIDDEFRCLQPTRGWQKKMKRLHALRMVIRWHANYQFLEGHAWSSIQTSFALQQQHINYHWRSDAWLSHHGC
jgi:hypothetical protein